ncbi:SGNH/GDSL hydrolase family protein [Actinomadura atramentaria]|uniref:SGNH/GDSL hydrolase family protein n=1 Tax=Actinomadura atramentaria TaxID=1990 RepID=UPI000364C9DD|nr:SGNH/GDSL hydrolase family protein [Actinomadura atramentaria]
MSDTKRILCFGDSLTWGWEPVAEAVPTRRHATAQRWPRALEAALGPGHEVVEEGLSGRTTTADDPVDPRLNGGAYLPAALASHFPLDLVVIMLGTNDAKAAFGRTPFDIATGMFTLVDQVARSGGGAGTVYPAPRALVVAPPPLGAIPDPWFAEVFRGAAEKIAELPRLYRALAGFAGAAFFDAGTAVATDGVDGIHLTGRTSAALGRALAEPVAAALL